MVSVNGVIQNGVQQSQRTVNNVSDTINSMNIGDTYGVDVMGIKDAQLQEDKRLDIKNAYRKFAKQFWEKHHNQGLDDSLSLMNIA